MACLYVPVWKVFAAFWPGRRTKFLSRRTTAKKKKRKTLNTRTPENPEFSSLESCVNFVETSRGFWLLINRLDKLFSKTLFLSCFWDFETCFVTIVLLQVESSLYYQGLSGVWCSKMGVGVHNLLVVQLQFWPLLFTVLAFTILSLLVLADCKTVGFFFLKIGFPKILAVSQSTRTSLKIRPSLVRFSDVLRPIELNIRKSELKKFICGVTWYFWEV